MLCLVMKIRWEFEEHEDEECTKYSFCNAPKVFKYKQNLLFRFIHLIMYVVHNMNHIHH